MNVGFVQKKPKAEMLRKKKAMTTDYIHSIKHEKDQHTIRHIIRLPCGVIARVEVVVDADGILTKARNIPLVECRNEPIKIEWWEE